MQNSCRNKNVLAHNPQKTLFSLSVEGKLRVYTLHYLKNFQKNI